MNSVKFIPAVFLIVPLFLSCKSEESAIDINQLSGQWVLIEAWRNGRPTETLTGTYYFFSPAGKMSTNLTFSGIDEEYDFIVSGNTVEQKSEPEEVVYRVEELSDSTLSLSLEIRKIPFKLKLVRNEPDSLERILEVQ